MSKRYQCDLTDKQWSIIEPLIPAEKDGGRPRSTDMREVMNAIFYMLRTGCQWDYLPKCFPAKSTVYDYFRSGVMMVFWMIYFACYARRS